MNSKEKRELIYEIVFGYEDYEASDVPYWMIELTEKIEQVLARIEEPK